MTSRCTPCPDPQFHSSDEGAGVTRCCSPRLHPKIEAAAKGAEMSRGRDGYSPASPLEDDDLLREILLRLPPQPSSLPRASAVCKRWLGFVTDPKFIRQFRTHHGKPPLVGAFVCSKGEIAFTPVLAPPDCIHPKRFDFGRYRGGRCCVLLDCRHGRVLFNHLARRELVVCDPITGQERRMAIPPQFRTSVLNSAVLCAARDQGHVHGGCHSSPFKVVLVSMTRDDNRPIACVYSSETSIWGNVISTEAQYHQIGGEARKPVTLVGNALYWLSVLDDILEFDLDEHSLIVTKGPPVTNYSRSENRLIIQAEDGAVGFAILCYPHFHMWHRNVNDHGVATWVPWKNIEMNRIIGLPPLIEGYVGGQMSIQGYDEDTVIFVDVDGSVYMVQLKSMQSRKLSKTIGSYRYHPFKSFYAPGMTIAGLCYGAEMIHDT